MSEEKALIRKCKNGDINSFELLIEQYQKKVFNIAFRMMGNQEDASDIAQEVFIRVYKSIKNFKEESSLSTWIYRIATNVCLDELRKRKKNNIISINSTLQLDDSELTLELEDPGDRPDELLQKKELCREIQEAIECLNEEHKAVIVLRDINGLSYEEISKILQCSLGTVKSRINRARSSLKSILLKSKEHFDQYNV